MILFKKYGREEITSRLKLFSNMKEMDNNIFYSLRASTFGHIAVNKKVNTKHKMKNKMDHLMHDDTDIRNEQIRLIILQALLSAN